METVRSLVQIYFGFGALVGAWFVLRTIHKLPDLGLVRYSTTIFFATLAWPNFIRGKWIW